MSENYINALNSLNNRSDLWALVIGDVMVDRYLKGTVNRVSPEAPVPVLHLNEVEDSAGGAANVASNLVALGVKTYLLGFVGKDDEAVKLRRLVSKNKISDALIDVESHPTVSKTRLIAGGQQMVRVDSESYTPYKQEDINKLIATIDDFIQKLPSVVILSDYAKGILTEQVCQHVIKSARSLNIPVLVDPKGRNYRKYKGATTITPNKQEASLASDIDANDEVALIKASVLLRQEMNIDYLVLTRSEEGVTLIENKNVTHIPAVAKQVFDVSGAGDTVIATLAAGLISGLLFLDALKLANIAAGIVVANLGTVPISKSELLGELVRVKSITQTSKIYHLEDLVSKVSEWRKNKDRIVFTNGCFDLLHAGHVKFLEKARTYGQKLILAINSDESVNVLKGNNRPVINESDRCRILSGLASVDAVIVFEDKSLLDLIEKLKPDVMVKGNDYFVSEVIGADLLKNWDGIVKIIPIDSSYSVSKIIERMTA